MCHWQVEEGDTVVGTISPGEQSYLSLCRGRALPRDVSTRWRLVSYISPVIEGPTCLLSVLMGVRKVNTHHLL